jgi:hypothetical protein
MAISPQHLVQLFTEEVDRFEQEIDKLLSTQKIYKGQTISVTAPKGLNLTHYQILKSRYIAAGWIDVQYSSDQRDGEWLNFKY